MKQKKRIGLFGGSFDPVHAGHITLAKQALEELALDKVIFIPAKKPPHKQSHYLAAPKHRIKMLSLATCGIKKTGISYYELEKKQTTFTYQTIEYFKQQYPNADIFFIMGSDSIRQVKRWKKPKLVISLCMLVVGKRGKAAIQRAIDIENTCILRKTIPSISSSQIRENLKANKSVHEWVDPKVKKYILKHGLYKK
jgi:nicotinate-nucleotide adenylyltransferase